MSKSKIKITTFGVDDPLSIFPNQSRQVKYLRCYLTDLSATSVIEESNYFDRDYLAEFAAFYSVSSKGYPNICRRFHFFSEKINRDTLRRAAGGSEKSIKKLQESYLGFIVLRPIPAAPLGRTILRWYPDNQEKDIQTPRVKTSREYSVHFLGIELNVEGIAWQQQDTGVGACATVSLWSMLHSSAFDDHHAIPTTADITRDAHSKHSFGSRMFPSQGLNFFQICDAIREQKLAPLITEGDIKHNGGAVIGFSHERFAGTCSSYIRSGYPILVIGTLVGLGEHAICLVGFRSCVSEEIEPLIPKLAESGIQHVYIHDDNLGPNVRFEISSNSNSDPVTLKASAPISKNAEREIECPTLNYNEFIPKQLIVATHNDIRTYPDTLHRAGIDNATYLSNKFNLLAVKNKIQPFGLIVSARFIKMSDFLGGELSTRISNKKILSRIRISLCEKVEPMSLHLGVVRISLDDSTPLVDILYDTTDSDRNHPVYAHIAYANIMPMLIGILEKEGVGEFGVCINAF